MNYDTERGHVNDVIDSKKRRDRVQAILIVAIVVALLGVTWNAWQSELRAREAERSATSLAEQVTAACAREGADLLVGGEDICERADDVAEDPSPTDGAAALEGPQGPMGPQGPRGPMGPRGFAGLDGKDGKDGKDGEPGSDGGTGSTGTPGADGKDGAPGEPGSDGREVQLRTNDAGDIQWRYMGEAAWTTLVYGSTLKGEKGDPGKDGNNAPPGPACTDGEVESRVWVKSDDGTDIPGNNPWVQATVCVIPSD